LIAQNILVPRITSRPRKRRSRFSAEQARDAILAATEQRLLEVGPQGLRLQDIARAVGLSHPTVLHHFGSREELVHAVTMRAMLKLDRELLACFTDVDAKGNARQLIHDILGRIDEVMRLHGHARLHAWLGLAGVSSPEQTLLPDLAAAVHAAAKAQGSQRSLEDAQFTVLLTSAATFGLALLDTQLLPIVGFEPTDAVRGRFRAWFAGLMVDHMLSP
jgi:AcrR family transcriptional regulator